MSTVYSVYFPTGETIYLRITDPRGNVYNGSGYVPFDLDEYASFAVPTVETPAGSGVYTAEFPESSGPSLYSISAFLQVGASPSVTDGMPFASDSQYWNGNAFGPTEPVGSGSIPVNLTITDTDDLPLGNVECWVSTDLAGTNVVAGTYLSSTIGLVTFHLDEGTYYLWRQHPSYTFSNPQRFTVTS